MSAPPASDDRAAQDESPLQKLIHSLPQTILGGTVAVLGSSHSLKALTTIPMFTGCLTITFLSSVLSIMFHRRYVFAARCSDHVAISFLVMAFSSVVSAVLVPTRYGWLVYVLCTVLMVPVVLKELQLLVELVNKVKGVRGGAEQPVPRRRWSEVLAGLVDKVKGVSGGAEQPVPRRQWSEVLPGLVDKVRGVSGGAEQPVPRRQWSEVLAWLVDKVRGVSGGAEQPVAGATAAAGNGKSPGLIRCRLPV